MANLTEKAHVIRATKWRLDSGYEGCSIYVVRDAAPNEQAIGYAIAKLNAAVEVFGDFASGAGLYELELAADLNRSQPKLTCVAAKYMEPLTVAANGSAKSQ